MNGNNHNAPLLEKTIFKRPGAVGTLKNRLFGKLKHEPHRINRLVEAITHNNQEEAVRLIKETGLTAKDIENKTVNTSYGYNQIIVLAAIHGNLKIVQALIDLGVNVNVDTKKNTHTPLWIGILDINVGLVDILIKAGANIETKHNAWFGLEPITPLHFACILIEEKRKHPENNGMSRTYTKDQINNMKEIIKLLVEAGANKDIMTSNGTLYSFLKSEPDILDILDPNKEHREVPASKGGKKTTKNKRKTRRKAKE